MPLSTKQLVKKIHDTPTQFVLTLAGGGVRAAMALLEVPGASRSVLEVVVPYSSAAMAALLSGPSDQACSAATARALAMAAFLRAYRWGAGDVPLAGISATASLATDRPKRGPHRVHLAAQTEAATTTQSLELTKDSRTRPQEERVVASLVLNLVAKTTGLAERIPVRLMAGELVEESTVVGRPAWRDLLLGRIDAARETGGLEGPSATSYPSPPTPLPQGERGVLFPGAFNPLHAGHRRIMDIAQELLGQPAEPEISILNVDKPPLDYFEIQRRVNQFEPDRTVWLTRLATFEEKSLRFPGATFVVGVDTLRRIADPKYYGNDPAACLAAVERIASRGCDFLVFGRLADGRFTELGHLDLPEVLRSISRAVPAEQFREDVSSTEIRRG